MKAQPVDRLSQVRSAAGPHASRDSCYLTARSERQLRAGVVPLSRLPRLCPFCQGRTIIGHGQRIRLAHDDRHEHIRVRRGRCLPCRKTFTILPDWLAPFGHYSLRCRQQTCERIAAGVAVEQAAPDCLDVTRSPDATTVRRWAQRRAVSIWRWFRVLSGRRLLPLPTIFAWDLTALCRMLPFEARSP